MSGRVGFCAVLTAICVLALVFVGAGCSGSKVETKASNELPRYHVRSLVLMPFTAISTPQARDHEDLFVPAPESIRRSDISLAIPSNVTPRPKQTAGVPEYATEKVTQLFWKRLQDRRGLQVQSPGAVAKAAAPDKELSGARPEKAAAMMAQRLHADAAVMGMVTMYQEREGSRLGADPPAAVGFEVKVVAADGQVLWVGGYYERQRPMTEDLIGFLQRWTFVTAEELAEYGVREVMKEFPFGEGEGN